MADTKPTLTLVKTEAVEPNGDGSGHFVSTNDLAIAKLTSNEQRIEDKISEINESDIEIGARNKSSRDYSGHTGNNREARH